MKYNPKQLIVDLAEWSELQMELDALRKPADGSLLTEAEHQEAVGILVVRTLQNPELIRRAAGSIDLGKYKAIFTQIGTTSEATLRVKFIRP